MYKNFTLTESEREEILNRHKEHGYKQPLNEQSTNTGQKILVYKDSQQSTTPFLIVLDGQGKKVGVNPTLQFSGHVSGQSNQMVQIQCTSPNLITVFDKNNKLVLQGYNKDATTKFCSGDSQPRQYQ